ncbi:uncharacterized protein [Oscarella lobularis]|uniref:uncharacterized protein isoform X2 n=1 Tax=Oscarella lobularis TaxID=121494 RepID=UPI00331410FC
MSSQVQLLSRNEFTLSEGDLLGSGRFSEVYAAKLLGENSKAVAAKVFASQEQKSTLHYFERECLVYCRIGKHPHIVAMVGVCISSLVLLLELVDGKSLEELFSDKILKPWYNRLDIASQISKGIQHLHHCGFVHCDLKPGNVLTAERNSVLICKVTDFGLSRLQSSCEREDDADGAFVGTPNYRAPEIREGRSASKESDVYSFGIMLWELSNKTLITERASNFLMVSSIVLYQRKLKDQPQEFANLQRSCCSIAPADRPSVEDCVKQLEIIQVKVSELDFRENDCPAPLNQRVVEFRCILTSSSRRNKRPFVSVTFKGEESNTQLTFEKSTEHYVSSGQLYLSSLFVGRVVIPLSLLADREIPYRYEVSYESEKIHEFSFNGGFPERDLYRILDFDRKECLDLVDSYFLASDFSGSGERYYRHLACRFENVVGALLLLFPSLETLHFCGSTEGADNVEDIIDSAVETTLCLLSVSVLDAKHPSLIMRLINKDACLQKVVTTIADINIAKWQDVTLSILTIKLNRLTSALSLAMLLCKSSPLDQYLRNQILLNLKVDGDTRNHVCHGLLNSFRDKSHVLRTVVELVSSCLKSEYWPSSFSVSENAQNFAWAFALPLMHLLSEPTESIAEEEANIYVWWGVDLFWKNDFEFLRKEWSESLYCSREGGKFFYQRVAECHDMFEIDDRFVRSLLFVGPLSEAKHLLCHFDSPGLATVALARRLKCDNSVKVSDLQPLLSSLSDRCDEYFSDCTSDEILSSLTFSFTAVREILQTCIAAKDYGGFISLAIQHLKQLTSKDLDEASHLELAEKATEDTVERFASFLKSTHDFLENIDVSSTCEVLKAASLLMKFGNKCVGPLVTKILLKMRFGFLLKILSLSAPDNFHSYFVKELEKLCLDFLNKKITTTELPLKTFLTGFDDQVMPDFNSWEISCLKNTPKSETSLQESKRSVHLPALKMIERAVSSLKKSIERLQDNLTVEISFGTEGEALSVVQNRKTLECGERTAELRKQIIQILILRLFRDADEPVEKNHLSNCKYCGVVCENGDRKQWILAFFDPTKFLVQWIVCLHRLNFSALLAKIWRSRLSRCQVFEQSVSPQPRESISYREAFNQTIDIESFYEDFGMSAISTALNEFMGPSSLRRLFCNYKPFLKRNDLEDEMFTFLLMESLYKGHSIWRAEEARKESRKLSEEIESYLELMTFDKHLLAFNRLFDTLNASEKVGSQQSFREPLMEWTNTRKKMRCFSQPDASRLILLKQFKNQSMTRFKEIGLLHSFCEGRNLIVWLRKEFREMNELKKFVENLKSSSLETSRDLESSCFFFSPVLFLPAEFDSVLSMVGAFREVGKKRNREKKLAQWKTCQRNLQLLQQFHGH